MYFNAVVFLALWCAAVEVSAKRNEFPPYIKACSRKSPDFKQCCVQHGNDAIPSLAKGDKKLGIPMLNPLKLPKIDASPGPSLKIIINDAVIWGLGDVKITAVDVDFAAQTIHIVGKIPEPSSLRISGNYDINGKILVLPIQGQGTCNITAIRPTFDYKLKFTLKKIKGQDHVELNPDDDFQFTVGDAYFHFDNLFNGDEKLGNQVNTFLNENVQDVVKEVGGSISGVIKTVAKTIANAVFKKVPFNELFLD